MAVGTHKGFVQIWDAAAGKKLSMLEGHTARVGEGPPASQGAGVIPWGPGLSLPCPLPGLQGRWPGTLTSCHPGAGTA